MQIVFDPGTLHQSRAGSITAVVYFDFGNGVRFPGEDWNDFIVVITNCWTRAFAEIVAHSREQKFLFMDGPYWISASPQGEYVRLICVEDRRSAGPACEVLVRTEEMRHQLVVLARNVSSACHRAGIESSDLNSLRVQLPN
jgi:RNA polymerase subunit RPABC4/transcription elongation factor Spt4